MNTFIQHDIDTYRHQTKSGSLCKSIGFKCTVMGITMHMKAMILFHLKCFDMLVPTYNITKSKKHLPYGKCEACTKTHFTLVLQI
jgi:hypothetical protein